MSLEFDRLNKLVMSIWFLGNNNTLASRRYIRVNPDPDPPPVYENPNLIQRILHQEISVIPVFKSRSCPVVCQYLEDLEFDEQFEFSLFETKSESVVGSTALNLEFVKDIETERANRSIDDYILRHQTAITATNIPKFLESASATLGSSAIASSSGIPAETPFIRTIPV